LIRVYFLPLFSLKQWRILLSFMVECAANFFDPEVKLKVSPADSEIQLQVWKDLAISKQILMGAATDALGLDAGCSTGELKEALEKAIQRAREADIDIVKMREQADQEIADMKAQVKSSEQRRLEAEERIAAAGKASDTAGKQLAIGRTENAEALKKARADVTDKQNKLKAISKALADTPENVVRKLKTLKKQKLEESRLNSQTESRLLATRKEKAKIEAQLETQKPLLEQGAKLIEQVRELHDLCTSQNKKIKSLSDDKKHVFKIPKLDQELLESLETAVSGDK
jgi:septal ring factor EnvC (AmiA/AmiB activator)